MGPNANGGKNVRPPTIRITLINNITNNQLSVLKVPEETGVIFFLAILSCNSHYRNNYSETAYQHTESNHQVIKNCVCVESPKALPLFPAAELNAYNISESPCGPALFRLDSPAGTEQAIAENNLMTILGASIARNCHFHFKGFNFFTQVLWCSANHKTCN